MIAPGRIAVQAEEHVVGIRRPFVEVRESRGRAVASLDPAPRRPGKRRAGLRTARPAWSARPSALDGRRGRRRALEVAGERGHEVVRLQVLAQRRVDLLERQRRDRRVDLSANTRTCGRGRGCSPAPPTTLPSCARDRRRKLSRPRWPSLSSCAVKPSFSARAISSRNAASTFARFCGAKIAQPCHGELGSKLFQSTPAAHVVRQALALADALPQPRVAAAAEQVVGQHQRRVVGVAVRDQRQRLAHQQGRVLLVGRARAAVALGCTGDQRLRHARVWRSRAFQSPKAALQRARAPPRRRSRRRPRTAPALAP